jgi:hypothetical protein
LTRDRVENAIEYLDQMKISNEMFKEHLMDLCMNKTITDQFEKLTPAQKSAFTRAWNIGHKDPT